MKWLKKKVGTTRSRVDMADEVVARVVNDEGKKNEHDRKWSGNCRRRKGMYGELGKF